MFVYFKKNNYIYNQFLRNIFIFKYFNYDPSKIILIYFKLFSSPK